MDLKKLKEAVALVNAFIAENESAGSFAKKPLPPNAKPAYDACRALWSAAQSDLNKGRGWKKSDGTPFTIFDYISGIQPMGQDRKPPKTPAEMQADIVSLGFTAEGKEWLSHDANAAQLDRDYQRHFNGYVAVRVNHNDEAQGYRRVE